MKRRDHHASRRCGCRMAACGAVAAASDAVVGFLHSASLKSNAFSCTAFARLEGAGFVEGQTSQSNSSGRGRDQSAASTAAASIGRQVAVIVVDTRGALRSKRQTHRSGSFGQRHPVKLGVDTSLNRPEAT